MNLQAFLKTYLTTCPVCFCVCVCGFVKEMMIDKLQWILPALHFDIRDSVEVSG